MKLWCVKVAYWYGEESPRDTLEADVRIFTSKEDAVKELERIIRNDWTSEVYVIDDGKRKMLADCRGMSEMDSVRWSDWYYSKDGTIAWCFYGTTHGYKGWVEGIEVPEPDNKENQSC